MDAERFLGWRQDLRRERRRVAWRRRRRVGLVLLLVVGVGTLTVMVGSRSLDVLDEIVTARDERGMEAPSTAPAAPPARPAPSNNPAPPARPAPSFSARPPAVGRP